MNGGLHTVTPLPRLQLAAVCLVALVGCEAPLPASGVPTSWVPDVTGDAAAGPGDTGEAPDATLAEDAPAEDVAAEDALPPADGVVTEDVLQAVDGLEAEDAAPSDDATATEDIAPDAEVPPALGAVEVFATAISDAPAEALVSVLQGAAPSEMWLSCEGSVVHLWRSGVADDIAWPEDHPCPQSAVAVPAAASATGEETLVGGPFGLLLLRDGAVVASPLATRFSGDPVSALARLGDSPGRPDVIWIAAASGLYRWQADLLTPVSSPNHRLAPGLLAGPAPVASETAGDLPALWLAAADGLLALHGSPALTLSLERPDLRIPAVQALGTTARGLVLAVADLAGAVGPDGTRSPGAERVLHVRTHDHGRGRWLTPGAGLAPLGPVDRLVSHPASPVAWARLTDGGLVLLREDGSLAAVTSPPAAFAPGAEPPMALAVLPDGRLLAAFTGGVVAVSAGRSVALAGLPAGGRLDGPVTVRVQPTDLAAVTAIEATVTPAGGPPMALDVGAAEGAEGTGSATPDGASPWPALGLTPLAFPNGSLTLRVVVTWRDGATAAVEATLTVALTAWQDVAPGLSRTCGGCHATGNTFGRLALDRAETVATNIDEILCRADVHVTPRASLPECQPLAPRVPASMPPGTSALSPAQLAALRAWRDGGFRRSDRD